jgi:hypothetical protein
VELELLREEDIALAIIRIYGSSLSGELKIIAARKGEVEWRIEVEKVVAASALSKCAVIERDIPICVVAVK